jgi:hypothetical protein
MIVFYIYFILVDENIRIPKYKKLYLSIKLQNKWILYQNK